MYRTFAVDQLEQLASGLDSLEKQFGVSPITGKVPDKEWLRWAAVGRPGMWAGLGLIDLTKTRLSKHFDNATIDVSVVSSGCVLVTACFRPSGRFRFDFRELIEKPIAAPTEYGKVIDVIRGRAVVGSNHPATERNRLLCCRILRAQLDASVFLRRYIGNGFGTKSVWSAIPTWRVERELWSGDLGSEVWRVLGVHIDRDSSHWGEGFVVCWPPGSATQVRSPGQVVVIDEEFVSADDCRLYREMSRASEAKLLYLLRDMAKASSLFDVCSEVVYDGHRDFDSRSRSVFSGKSYREAARRYYRVKTLLDGLDRDELSELVKLGVSRAKRRRGGTWFSEVDAVFTAAKGAYEISRISLDHFQTHMNRHYTLIAILLAAMATTIGVLTILLQLQ